jgi:hypothetical protein
MLDRAEAQAERVRDPAWQAAQDRWQPHACSFRATAEGWTRAEPRGASPRRE